MRSTCCRSLVVLTIACVGCVVSPVPQPPNVDPPAFEIGDVTGETCGACDGEAVFLHGPPGSATHPDLQDEVVIWIANLDRPSPIRTTSANPDGSFTVDAAGLSTDVYRIQARVREARSTPVDVTLGDDGEVLIQVSHPAAAYLEAEPAMELEFGAAPRPVSASILLHNTSEQVIELGSVVLRAPTEAFEVPSPPDRVAVGEEVLAEVLFLADEPGAHEEILLIEVTAPVADRFAVTLLARVVED